MTLGAEVYESGLMAKYSRQLFGGGFYAAALAPWRLHMLQPGRALVIDAHAYSDDRVAVMRQVGGCAAGWGPYPGEAYVDM